jgi:hypothetical protein
LYFPTTAIVWLLYVRENGSSDEIPVVNEGIIGISLVMGGEPPAAPLRPYHGELTCTPASSSATTLFRW